MISFHIGELKIIEERIRDVQHPKYTATDREAFT